MPHIQKGFCEEAYENLNVLTLSRKSKYIFVARHYVTANGMNAATIFTPHDIMHMIGY